MDTSAARGVSDRAKSDAAPFHLFARIYPELQLVALQGSHAHSNNPSTQEQEAAGPGRKPSHQSAGGTLPSRQTANASTFRVGGGPGDDAPHQAAVEQDLLGKSMISTEVLQVLPPLGSLGRRAHGGSYKHSLY